MNKLFFLILLLITLSTSNILLSQNQIKENIDTYHSLKGTDRLKKIYTNIKSSESPLEVIELLEKEADKQNNQLYLAQAYREKVYFFSKQSQRDSVKHYLNKATDKLDILDTYGNLSDSEKEELERIRIAIITTKSYTYINESKYDIVLVEVKNMLENSKNNMSPRLEFEAYTLLGSAYLYTKDLPEAIKCFRKAFDINKQIFGQSPQKDYNFYRPMEGLSIAYGGSEKHKEAIQISDSLINKIEETYKYLVDSGAENSDKDFIYNFLKHRASCYYALWNAKTGNTKRARIQLDSINHFIKNNYNTTTTPADFDIYDYVETNYWFAVKNYAKAKEYALSMTNRTTIEKGMFTYMLANLELARILNAEGNCQAAYKLIEKLYWQNDSISAMNFSSQVAEMQTLYQLDKAEIAALQSKKELISVRKTLSIAFVAIVLSVIIAVLIWQNRRKIVKKNIQLYNQYIEIKNRNQEIAALQLGLKQNNSKEDEVDSNSVIIEKLDTYLQETKSYLNPDLTREELAVQIGTNRQYLIEAIKEKRGKTFNEYIYSYRLEYAHEQIINNRKKSISEILVEAGFQTRTTFYKSFKEVYGLTPSELRSILD